MNQPYSFIGKCNCGAFNLMSNQIGELLIDGSIKSQISSSIVSAWPVNAPTITDPLLAMDYCISYKRSCTSFMRQMNCPKSEVIVNACDNEGLLHHIGKCECGSFDIASVHIGELMIDVNMNKRYDLMPYNGYPTLASVSMCEAYHIVCTNW
jgi:hypothetical protein